MIKILIAVGALCLSLITLQYKDTSIPVQQTSSEIIITVPDYFTDNYTTQWNTINDTLVHTKAQKIVLIWQGDGGYVYMGEKTIEAMQTAEAEGKIIEVDVVGPSISMHAVTVCYASVVHQNDTLVFHAISTFNPDGSRNYTLDPLSLWAEYKMLDQCKMKGFLTDYDIYQIVTYHKRVEVFPDGWKEYLPDYH